MLYLQEWSGQIPIVESLKGDDTSKIAVVATVIFTTITFTHVCVNHTCSNLHEWPQILVTTQPLDLQRPLF